MRHCILGLIFRQQHTPFIVQIKCRCLLSTAPGMPLSACLNSSVPLYWNGVPTEKLPLSTRQESSSPKSKEMSRRWRKQLAFQRHILRCTLTDVKPLRVRCMSKTFVTLRLKPRKQRMNKPKDGKILNWNLWNVSWKHWNKNWCKTSLREPKARVLWHCVYHSEVHRMSALETDDVNIQNCQTPSISFWNSTFPNSGSGEQDRGIQTGRVMSIAGVIFGRMEIEEKREWAELWFPKWGQKGRLWNTWQDIEGFLSCGCYLSGTVFPNKWYAWTRGSEFAVVDLSESTAVAPTPSCKSWSETQVMPAEVILQANNFSWAGNRNKSAHFALEMVEIDERLVVLYFGNLINRPNYSLVSRLRRWIGKSGHQFQSYAIFISCRKPKTWWVVLPLLVLVLFALCKDVFLVVLCINFTSKKNFSGITNLQSGKWRFL